MNAPALTKFDIPAADLDEAREFLKALDPNADAFTFCTFDDVESADGRKRKAPELTQARHGTLDTLAPWLESMNQLGAGVFVTVNETDGTGKRQKENIKRVRAVWIDDDGKDAAKSNRSRQAAYDALVPSLEVETSPGKRHLYWVADGLSFDDHEAVMRRLVADYNCDRGAADLARVLRVPGFHHAKGALLGEFPRVRVVNSRAMIAEVMGEEVQPLSRADVLKAFPPIAREAPAAKTAPETFKPGDWMKPLAYVTGAADRKRWVDVGAALHFEGGGSDEAFDLWAAWSSTAPNYDKPDCERVWSSFGKYAGPPLTGDSIKRWAREGGYTGAEVEFADLPDTLNSPPATDGEDAFEFDVIDPRDWQDKPIPAREFIVPDFIPKGHPTLFYADGGLGKSLLMTMLGVARSLKDAKWLGLDVEPGRTTILSAEDDAEEMHRRVADICEHYGCKLSDLADLKIIDRVGEDVVIGALSKQNAKIEPTAIYRALVRHIERQKPDLLILDALADLFSGNENDRPQARQFIGMLKGLCRKHGVTVVIVAHPSVNGLNSGTGTSGSTAWSNSVRSRFYLEADANDPDGRTLTGKKANYSRKGVQIKIRYADGVFVPIEAVRDNGMREAIADRTFLDLLSHFNATGQRVGPNPGSNYAPARLANEPQAGGLSKQDLGKAMQRLLRSGRIKSEGIGPPSRRVTHLIIASDASE